MTTGGTSSPSAAATDWVGADFQGEGIEFRRWRRALWALIYPRPGHRVVATVSGMLLIAVAMGIGLAAYNTASNILFITLSLLLACLVFSAVFSWWNLKSMAWRLRVTPPLRAGQEHAVALELRNRKRVLPTYGLWFDLQATGCAEPMRRALTSRLDPAGEATLEWTLRPEARGAFCVELVGAGSLFPFGFLKKTLGLSLRREVLVWPAPVEYRRFAATSRRQSGPGEARSGAGQGGDLLALRPYAQGDSQRMVHWKASARLRRLVVRQVSAEARTGVTLWLRTEASTWRRPAQFELLCGLAATLAEDFFRAGHLASVMIDGEAAQPVRGVRDLELFLDRIALAKVNALAGNSVPSAGGAGRRSNLMTFAPDGARGVVAFIDGKPAASA